MERLFNSEEIRARAIDLGTSIPLLHTRQIHDSGPRGHKRSASPDVNDKANDDLSGKKRGRPRKNTIWDLGDFSQQSLPKPSLPHGVPTIGKPMPDKPPIKQVIKALPTVRDHTTDTLNPEGDEYIPRDFDSEGEKKVSPDGHPLGGREYRPRTFLLPNRGDKLFMLATECARILAYRDSYLLFNKNRSLYKIIANQTEKDDLIQQEILPYSYRSRQIAVVTAKSIFRQFGSRIIEHGRRVRDDYWEAKARKQGFTEEDIAGEKRPGRARAERNAQEANMAHNPGLIYHGAHDQPMIRPTDESSIGDMSSGVSHESPQKSDFFYKDPRWPINSHRQIVKREQPHSSSDKHLQCTPQDFTSQNQMPSHEIHEAQQTDSSPEYRKGSALGHLGLNTTAHLGRTASRDINHSEVEDQHLYFQGDNSQSLPHPFVSDIESCCEIFVAGLLKHMKPCKGSEKVVSHVVQILPDLLRVFALYLGDDKEWSDTVAFIFRHKREICTIFKDQWLCSKFNLDKNIPETHALPSDVVDTSIDEQPTKLSNTHRIGEFIPTHIKDNLRKLDIKHEPVEQSPAYEWLTTRLCSSFQLTIPKISKFNDVHDSILHYLLESSTIDSRMVRSFSSTNYLSVKFELGFDAKEIWNNIPVDDEDNWIEVLGNCITLTSDGENMQALTCLQYLEQTWPTRGSHIFPILNLLRGGSDITNMGENVVTAEVLNGKTLISVSGTVWLIAEIGEQLAWLGSAFRMSSSRDSVYQCTAKVASISKNTSTALPNEGEFRAEYYCAINYTISMMEQNSTSDQCWQGLFKYPVVAKWFPVARRNVAIPGMEMTLSAMTALCCTRNIGKFEHSIVIKGFSSMFTLTERHPGLSIWHFRGSPDGDHISYPDATKLTEFRDLGVHEIIKDRHFVGWCLESTYGAGAIDSNYDIQHSRLLGTYPGHLLHEKSLRRGLLLQEEKVFLLGDKKLPRRSHRESYFERLRRLHSRPVVFWDTGSQRGWLTNGTSALLHLTFASLENDIKDKDDPFANAFRFQRNNIKHPDTHTNGSAATILLDEDNLELEILSYGGERRLFKDRVQDLFFLLEMMIDYQTAVIQTARSPLTCIEGWDFMDVADLNHEILHPRVFVPDNDSSGWITFLKDTCAITLYGRNFGEIYKPVSYIESCAYWTNLPTDKCYVAASIADLERIIKSYNGDGYGDPRRLTENTCWPSLSSTFEACKCNNVVSKHKNLVQILVPRQMLKNHRDTSTRRTSTIHYEIPKLGAVIFGQITDHHWYKENSQAGSEQKAIKKYKARDGVRVCRRSAEARVPESMSKNNHNHNDYLAAIICALPKELLAVRLLFDQLHDDLDMDEHDMNRYAFGEMSGHNVVAVCLPSGIYGTCSATKVASHLQRSFPKIKFCLVVGIGGGIPSSQNDIRLGDVVISHPANGYGGMIKYDFEKVLAGRTPQNIGSLRPPPEFLLTAIGDLRSNPDLPEEPLRNYLDIITQRRPQYSYPGRDLDRLYASNYSHSPLENSCSQCIGEIVHRESRVSDQPYIHYGLIASGDKVVKDPVMRDRIGNEFNAICIEMEGAGIANVLPSLIIRGISDYSDSHKHKIWQEYACASAAAYAKVLLQYIKYHRNGEV